MIGWRCEVGVPKTPEQTLVYFMSDALAVPIDVLIFCLVANAILSSSAYAVICKKVEIQNIPIKSARELITYSVFPCLKSFTHISTCMATSVSDRKAYACGFPLYLVLKAAFSVPYLSTCMSCTASPGAAASPRNSCICLWLTCRE